MANKWESNEEIQIFQEYLRIPSVHPNIDYESCVDFIRKQAESLGLPMKVYYPAKKTKPIAIITYIGTEPELESIYFNSHMDVVPVYEELWTHPPFGAEIDDEGLIFARGAQDMKSLGTQYLGALRYFIKNNIRFKRTIHVGFVPDEEIGGHDGMAAFVHTDDFRNLNIGCGFDEGCPSENDTFFLFYGEKITWQLKFTCEGTPGHGCFVVDNTAGEKAAYIINKMMNYRAEQLNSLNDKPDFSRSDITTLNLTVMKGGVQSNVVPPSFEFCFDVRISINTDHIALEEQIRTWMTEAGEGVSLEFLVKAPFVRPVPLDDKNIYWGAIKKCFAENGIKCKAGVIPGATDIQQLRALGIPAFGFSPLKNTKLFIHEHDEHLHADVYLYGIEVYKKLIPAIANC